MRQPHRRALVMISLLGAAFISYLHAQDAPKAVVSGSDFQNPIYLRFKGGKSTVQGVGDRQKRPSIIYVVRLEQGQQLTATLASTFKIDPGPQPFQLFLFDSQTSSFLGSSANWLVRKAGVPINKKQPSLIEASFEYVAPVTDDYYITPVFQRGGTLFDLSATIQTLLSPPHSSNCVKGIPTKPSYISPGVSNSRISDITIGNPAKANHPDQNNRRFCLTSACAIQPPKSVVLTIKLWEAFDAKAVGEACWDESNTITEFNH
jgi:hypothetical protein